MPHKSLLHDNLELTLAIDVYEYDRATGKFGKRVSHQESKAHSFLYQFVVILGACLTQANSAVTCPDTGNTARTIGGANPINDAVGRIELKAGSGTITYGLVVGTDNTAVTPTDYKLGTQIADGSGGSQLRHSGVGFSIFLASTTKVFVVVTRHFLNLSGGTITVNEVGMYARSKDSVGTARYFCVVRDIPAGAVSITDGQVAVITYTLSATS